MILIPLLKGRNLFCCRVRKLLLVDDRLQHILMQWQILVKKCFIDWECVLVRVDISIVNRKTLKS